MTWTNGVSGPWSNPATFDQNQWSAMVASWFPGGGVRGDPNSNDLKVYADATGMQVKLRVGTGLNVGQWVNATAETTIPIGASSGNPRIDRVVLRRYPSGSPSDIEPLVIAGTAGVTPVPPALTAQDLPLALVTVPASAVTIVAGNVTDDRTFLPTPRLTALDAAHLPTNPILGQSVWVKTLGSSVVWNGSAWAAEDADGGWLAITAYTNGWGDYTGGGSYPPAAQARNLNSVIHLRGLVVRNTNAATATVLTTTFAPQYTHRWTQTSSAGATVDWVLSNTGVLTYNNWSGTGPALTTSIPIDTCYPIN